MPDQVERMMDDQCGRNTRFECSNCKAVGQTIEAIDIRTNPVYMQSSAFRNFNEKSYEKHTPA